MKNLTSNLLTVAAAAVLSFTLGCAPAAPTDADTSTDTAADTSSSSNVTATAETPAGETPE